MHIYVPKQIIPIYPTQTEPLFFLAGPIRGGGDWQHPMALEILRQCSSAHIACPSRWTADHPLSSHFRQPFSQAPNRQLVWERHYMEQAAGVAKEWHQTPGCLIFWLGLENRDDPHPGPEPYAMDTRRELGKFTALRDRLKARVVLGGDRQFYGLDVILNEFAYADGVEKFPFYESMSELVTAAIAEAIT